MSRSSIRSTNLYYAVEPQNDHPDLVWDSDDSITKRRIGNSPRFRLWCRNMSERAWEEGIYDKWKNITSKSDEHSRKVEAACEWKVYMFESVVHYIYKPRINGTLIEGYKFRIKFEYVRPVRRWFLRLGGSFIPDHLIAFLDLSRFETGVRDPTGKRTLTFMSTLRRLIDSYMIKQQYVNEFLANVKKNYHDLNVLFDKELKMIKLVYKAGREDVWIPDLPKTSRRDTITLEMKLDNNFIVTTDDGIGVDYRVSRKASLSEQRQLYRSLYTKIGIFTRRPLKEAFEEFMSESTFE